MACAGFCEICGAASTGPGVGVGVGVLGVAALTPAFTTMLVLSGADDTVAAVAAPGVLGVGSGSGASGAGDLLADTMR